jgi:hypothetical protein
LILSGPVAIVHEQMFGSIGAGRRRLGWI